MYSDMKIIPLLDSVTETYIMFYSSPPLPDLVHPSVEANKFLHDLQFYIFFISTLGALTLKTLLPNWQYCSVVLYFISCGEQFDQSLVGP